MNSRHSDLSDIRNISDISIKSDISHYQSESDVNINQSNVSQVSTVTSGENSDEFVTSSQVSVHRIHTAILPYSRAHPSQNGWTGMDTFILASMVLCLAALIMEAIAYKADKEWNAVVYGDKGFPVLEKHEYFKHLMFHMDTKQPRLRIVQTLILREAVLEPVAIMLIIIFLGFLIISMMLSTQGEGLSRSSFAIIHGLGGFVMLSCSIMILVSDLNIDSAHKAASVELRKYITRFRVKPPKNIPPENYDLILEQAENLAMIQDVCALGSSNGEGRFSLVSSNRFIYIAEEPYTFKDLKFLGFCSQESLKFAAFICCFIFSFMCFTVPLCDCCIDRRKRKSIKPIISNEPHHEFSETDERQYSSISPRSDLSLVINPKKVSDDFYYKIFPQGFFDEHRSSMDSIDSYFSHNEILKHEEISTTSFKRKPSNQSQISLDPSLISGKRNSSPPDRRKSEFNRKSLPLCPSISEVEDSERTLETEMEESSKTTIMSPSCTSLKHDMISELPEVPKTKLSISKKKAEYVYKSQYTVRKSN